MTPQVLTASANALATVREELGRRTGLRLDVVSDEALERTLKRVAAKADLDSLGALVNNILAETNTERALLQQLVRELTIGETTFYRHSGDIEFLRSEVFPDLVRRRWVERRINIWSAGCSTGEEVYTLAALLLEQIPQPETWDLRILGTDMNTGALEKARLAEYGSWSFRGVSETEQSRWFDRLGQDCWRPIEVVRRIVSFDYLNLRDPIYPAIFTRTTEMDLILCRNVFIYFFPKVVQFVLGHLALCLRPEGWILCGPSDLMEADVPAVLQRIPMRNALRLEELGLEAPAVSPSIPQPDSAPQIDRFLARSRRVTSPISRPTSHPLLTRSVPSPPSYEDLVLFLRAGRYEDAITAARTGLEKDPLSVEMSRVLALALSDTPDAAAIDAWKKVLYLAPSDAAAHLCLGFVFLKSHRQLDARRQFKTVVRLLEGVDDAHELPGPDTLSAGWVRATCKSLSRTSKGYNRE